MKNNDLYFERRPSCRANMAGYTLIELVVVIVIVGLVGGLGGLVLTRMYKGHQQYQQMQSAEQIGQVALQQLNQVLRQVHRVEGPLSVAGVTQLTFATAYGQRIRYQFAGQQLVRQVVSQAGSVPRVVMTGVQALSFRSLNRHFARTTIPADVRCIAVRFTLSALGNAHPFASVICPRDLQYLG